MKQIQQLLLSLVLTVVSSAFAVDAAGQTYSVDYKNMPIEQVIRDLRKRTGYEIVYQKPVIAGVPSISCTYKNLTLVQLLNRVLLQQAGIDYEIVKKSIVLKKSTLPEEAFFKKQVIGTVTDEKDEPLVGVTILQKGTGNGATTDTDGNFSLIVEGTHAELEISYVGYKNRTVKIDRRTPFLALRLAPDETLLDEVLVTGYQNIKRENAVGAYQTISSKELDSRYTGNVVSRLEGQIPGLVAYNNGNGKTGEATLTIRGAGSFNARTNPLVVVDGLPIEGSIETVNPYDIETINVLKDASAASIYGARASNGVIVITTKRAHAERLSIDVNADLSIYEKQDYSNYGWANAAQLLQLEENNFNWVTGHDGVYSSLLGNYQTGPGSLTPATRLLLRHKLGEVSDADYNAQMAQWRSNDFRREWRDATLRTRVLQQYNVAMRTQGKRLNSNIVLNYKGDNNGVYRENDRIYTASYQGDMNLCKWLDASFGLNVISERSRVHSDAFNTMTISAFAPYLSMYNTDGTPAAMDAIVWLGEPSLKDPSLGLKDEGYYYLDELNHNFTNGRRNNIRSYVHANFKILPELSVSTRFQYEDISYKGETFYEPDSYYMRTLYNFATSKGKHYIPEGGMLKTKYQSGDYYTFRAQANYNKIFAEKHAVEAIAGFEYRQSHDRYNNDLKLGYDDQTQTNLSQLINFEALQNLSSSDLGPNYSLKGSAPSESDFSTSDILHRFYSYYFNANYTYDSRYAAQVSYRVDKADLFGADPKYRGRPLWSVGASWNMQNEHWMKPLKWIDVLKLRASYGLTGNIDSIVSSYLTAAIAVSQITGNKYATLNTPPNDQLRWEKTVSWNFGADFSLFDNRVSGSLDYYIKNSSDLLTLTDVDPTTGWSSVNINNGKARNTGVELQLNGDILRPATSDGLGVNASFNLAYNNNKVTRIDHEPSSGFEALTTLHEGHPINSLYSYRYAGMVTDDGGNQSYGWYDKDGNIHASDVSTGEFSQADVVFSGSLDPKVVASFTPEITWKGFSLSALFSFYGGHYMRTGIEKWTHGGSELGYSSELSGIPASYLDFWTGADTPYAQIANGYQGRNTIGDYQYIDQAVVHADYLKVRNIVLGYTFPKQWTTHLGIQSMRLRVQMNNVATWVRNSQGIDPEAVNPYNGDTLDKPCRSYTMSLSVSF